MKEADLQKHMIGLCWLVLKGFTLASTHLESINSLNKLSCNFSSLILAAYQGGASLD